MVDYYLTDENGLERWIRSPFNTFAKVYFIQNDIIREGLQVTDFRVIPEKKLSELVRHFDSKTQQYVETNSTNRLQIFGSLYEDGAIYCTGEQTKMRLVDETPEEWEARVKTHYPLVMDEEVYPNRLTEED